MSEFQKYENSAIDYVLGKEVLATKRIQLSYGEPIRIQTILAEEHSIHVTTQRISARMAEIRKGQHVYSPSGDYNGETGSRAGKDLNYAGFWALVDAYIPFRFERKYIGLAANQMDVVRSHISNEPVVVVEKDKKKATELMQMAHVLNKTRIIPEIRVIQSDIFKISPLGSNIIDLDLMCAFPKNPTQWLEWLSRAADLFVVNITTCVGRFVTQAEYNDRTYNFRKQISEYRMEIVARSPFSYRDRRIPMRSERLVIRKTGESNEQTK